MADIDVVPKRRTNAVWAWILLALIVVALLFVLLAGSRADASPTVQQYGRTVPPWSNAPTSTLLLI